MNQVLGLLLEPLDVLFFRDGRPFAPATRGRSMLPLPQTLAGALWTAILEQGGCNLQTLRQALLIGRKSLPEALIAAGAADWLSGLTVRGPWLTRLRSGELEVLVAVPAVVHQVKGGSRRQKPRLIRLRPQPPVQLPGWTTSLPESQAEMWPLWHRCQEPTEVASGYLAPRGLRAFLAGNEVSPEDLVPMEELFAFDHRTGIGVDPQRLTAQESLIYSASFLALRPDVYLYAEVLIPDASCGRLFENLSTVAIGGEGRRAAVSVLPRAFDWNALECRPAGGHQRPLVLATTPALLASGWKPAWDDASLIAAAVPAPLAVSGWDLVRGGPKPTRHAVPAGSCYFYANLPQNRPPILSDRAEDQRQGWGCYLTGVWTE